MAGKLISDLDPIASIIDTTLTEVEDASVSYKATMLQVLNYIISSGGGLPPGSITEFASDTIPTGWLLCDGQAVSRTTYSALFSVIGTTWGVGDGSTTFNVPDFREASPYGVGTRAAGVTAHDAATLGEFKDDQMQQITGSITSGKGIATADGPATRIGAFSSSTTTSNTYSAGSSTGVQIHFDSATSPGARTGTTTRGKLLGVNFIIKY